MKSTREHKENTCHKWEHALFPLVPGRGGAQWEDTCVFRSKKAVSNETEMVSSWVETAARAALGGEPDEVTLPPTQVGAVSK